MTALSLKRADGKVDAVGKVSIGEMGRENSALTVRCIMMESCRTRLLGANVDFSTTILIIA